MSKLAVLFRIACALLLAVALVPAVAPQDALAASETTYYGFIEKIPVLGDDGLPLYADDGVTLVTEDRASIEHVETDAETLTLPSTVDLVVSDSSGEKTVKDLEVSNLWLSRYDGSGDTCPNLKTLDLSQCASLEGADINVDSIETVTLNGSSGLENVSLSGANLRQINGLDTLTSVKRLFISVTSQNGQLSLPSLTVPSCIEELGISGVADLAQINGLEQSQIGYLSVDDAAIRSLELPETLYNLSLSRLPHYAGTSDFASLGNLHQFYLLDIPLSGTIGVPAAVESMHVTSCPGIEAINGLENATGLLRLSVTRTGVKSLSVPNSVQSLDVRHNHLSEDVTGPLVERFGKNSVLPQGESTSASVRLDDGPLTNYAFAVGDKASFWTTYCPSLAQREDFYAAADDSKSFTVTAVSANEAVASVETIEASRYESASFSITANGVGTTTIDVFFSGNSTFDDASCSVEVTVVDKANPVVSVEFDTDKATAYLFDNPFSPGEQIRAAANVAYRIVPADPSKPFTGQYSLMWDYTNADSLVYSVDFMEGNALRVYPAEAGETTLCFQLHDMNSPAEPIKADLPYKVVGEMTKPTLKSVGAITIDTEVYAGATVSAFNQGCSVASYADLDTNAPFKELVNRYYGYVEGAKLAIPHEYSWPFVTSVVSSDPAVMEARVLDSSVPYEGSKHWDLIPRENGTTTLAITDFWGDTVTCDVTLTNVVKPTGPSEMKGSFTKEEYVVRVGDNALVNAVESVDGLEGWVAECDYNYPVGVKSSNNNVFKIYGDHLIDVSPFGVVFGHGARGVACQPGEITLQLMGYPWEEGPDGSPVRKEVILDTCTVHVTGKEQSLVTSIVLSPEGDSTVELGSTLQMSATLSPVGAENANNLAWSSSDEKVLTVDASGKVTPVGVGVATITATVGDVSASAKVTVVEKAVPATAVSIATGAKVAMKTGETQQLTVAVEPVDTTDNVVWSSSDVSVLTVDPSGLVTAVGNGTATITATAGSVSAATDSIAVTTSATGVKLDSTSLELYAGAGPSKLTATVEPSMASDKEVTWSSSDESVATVDVDGNVTPVSAGSATITATAIDGGHRAACEVMVKQHVEGIALDKTNAAIIGKGTIQLSATVAPDSASNKNVTWTSSDESVATVDAHGAVTSVGKGEATITATSEDGGKSALCKVAVSNPATKLTLDPSVLDMARGDSALLSVALTGALSGAVDDCAVSVESSDKAVATVEAAESDAYTVKAVKTGTATITATAEGLDLVGTCSVRVSTPVQLVAISEAEKSATVGDAPFVLNATISPTDADDPTVSWTSSDASVASVAKDGTVTMHKAGKATITATVGGKSAQCSVVVAAKQVAVTQEGLSFAATVEVADAASVGAIEKATPEGDALNLVVQAVEDLSESAKVAIESLAVGNTEIAGRFDIHFASVKTGDEIIVNGNEDDGLAMTVRVLLTDDMRALDPDTLTVWYVAGDGALEKKPSWVENDYLCFTTEHFSNYVVTGEPPVQQAVQGSGQVVVSADSPVSPTALAPTADNLTGAVSVVGVVVLCSFVVVAVAVALIRRREC